MQKLDYECLTCGKSETYYDREKERNTCFFCGEITVFYDDGDWGSSTAFIRARDSFRRKGAQFLPYRWYRASRVKQNK